MKSIFEANDLKDKRVLVRVDWNVPIEAGVVLDDFRIKKSLPTLEYLKKSGAQVVLATHLEAGMISDLTKFIPEDMRLLDNLRDNPGEESNSEGFARELSSQADIFVNEAFSVSHRHHASIVGVAKLLPSYAGIQFMKEIENLREAFDPPKPFLFILGGAKVETKVPLIEKFLNTADYVFIGGTLAVPVSKMPIAKNPRTIFPIGDIAALDVNLETIALLKEKVENSAFILWNGPLGKYEKEYKWGTLELAKVLADSGKKTFVGGGDTLAAIKELGLYDKFSFVSTGGGAMLDFLATGTLPGIEALNN